MMQYTYLPRASREGGGVPGTRLAGPGIRRSGGASRMTRLAPRAAGGADWRAAALPRVDEGPPRADEGRDLGGMDSISREASAATPAGREWPGSPRAAA